MERRALVFLVGRMNLVVVAGEADQQAVHSELALERTDDWNRPAAADQRRGLAPFGLERATGEAQRLVLGRQRNGGAAGVADELGLHVRRQPRCDEGPKRLRDALRVLLADEPKRNLGAGLGRQDCLCACARVAADNSIDVAGRPRPELFERRAVALACRRRQPDVAQERDGVEIELVPLIQDFLRRVFDPLVEARHGDGAGIVVQGAKDLRERMNGVDGHAAVEARMQIPVGAGEDHFLAHDPAQRSGDGRR